jgi:uroporphyrin-III C-methyltransferase
MARRLVSSEILDLVHASARMVYVGKEKGMHTRTQEEIHELLHQWASDVPTVLRLKGGDPFIFGRGGEEAEYLRKRGVEVYCIPGV